jgi:hypothetical protein
MTAGGVQDGGKVPQFMQPTYGGLWLRRGRDREDALHIPTILSKMQALCRKADRIVAQNQAFSRKHKVWAQRLPRGIFVYRVEKDKKYGNVIGSSYEEGFKPTKEHLAAGAAYQRLETRMAQCGAAWNAYSYLLLRALTAKGLTKHPTLPNAVHMVVVKDDVNGFLVTYSQTFTKVGGFGTAESPSWPWTSTRLVQGHEFQT